jgi:hypothetical protein
MIRADKYRVIEKGCWDYKKLTLGTNVLLSVDNTNTNFRGFLRRGK